MWQKSLRVAYTFDRVSLYYCALVSLLLLLPLRPPIKSVAEQRASIRELIKEVALVADRARSATHQCFWILSDVTTVASTPPGRCAFSSTRSKTGVLTGSSTFEPLARKASYMFTAPPK